MSTRSWLVQNNKINQTISEVIVAMNEYVYDPTRRFPKIYDNTPGLFLMIIGSVGTFIMTMITLVVLFGDHNYVAAAINGSIVLFSIFLASPMIRISDRLVHEKRQVYNHYLGMRRNDRKIYKNYIRTIHKDRYGDSSLDYNDLIKLFKSKSLSNPNSVESARATIREELKNLKAMEKLNAATQAEVDKINKNFNL